MMMIKGTTKILGVVGYPIVHSLSPVMHNAAIEHLGADYVYVPFR
jgi:shikimate dehydrogenase